MTRSPERVLIVTPQPFYEDRGTPIAVACVARALSEQGRKVDVLSFPIGRRLYLPGLTIERASNPFRIERVGIGFSMRKLALDFSLLSRFRALLESRHYDVVHAVEEAAWMAAMLCPPRRQRFIYDMASAIPDELRAHRVLGVKPLQTMMRAAERRVIARADQVVCSAGLAERVRGLGLRTPVAEWHFPVFEAVEDFAAANAQRQRLGIEPGARVALYAGNFSRYQGLDLLLDAFVIAARRDPTLVLVCVGAEDDGGARLLARVPDPLRERLYLLPRVPRHEVARWFTMADCLVSPRSSVDNLPLKIFEYMAARRPVVATRHAAHERLLGHGRGVLCEPNAPALADAILAAVTDREGALRVATRAAEHVQRHHSWERFSRFIDDIYSGLVRPPAGPEPRGAPDRQPA